MSGTYLVPDANVLERPMKAEVEARLVDMGEYEFEKRVAFLG